MSPHHQSHREGLTIVATVSGMLRAEVLKSKLEAAGIKALLSYHSAGLIFGIALAGSKLSEVQILVVDRDAETARRILTVAPPPG